jgi:hypothetical protein
MASREEREKRARDQQAAVGSTCGVEMVLCMARRGL